MSLFRRRSTEPDPVDVQTDAIRALAGLLQQVGSDRDWDSRVMTIKPLLSGIEFRIDETADGDVGVVTGVLPDEYAHQALLLRRAMTTDNGTWLSMRIMLTREGGADATFNYMDEPGAVDGPPGMAPHEVHAHLEAFPRPAHTIPDWMRARLDGQEPPADSDA